VALQVSSPDNPLLLVPVTVNGRGPYDFVVDTGASHVVIDTALADELGLQRQDVVTRPHFFLESPGRRSGWMYEGE
jgi:predicted aspartyl protease